MFICICKSIDETEIELFKDMYPTNWRAMLVCHREMGKGCGICAKYLNKNKEKVE